MSEYHSAYLENLARHTFPVPGYHCHNCSTEQTTAVIFEKNGVCVGSCPKCLKYVKNYNPSFAMRKAAVAPATVADHFYFITASGRVGNGIHTTILGVSDKNTSPIADAYRAKNPSTTVRIEVGKVGKF